jgi:MerR family transcriptional regulator, copper efflux regulator
MDPVRLPIAKQAIAKQAIAKLAEALPEGPPEPERLLQVGDLAKEAGKTVRALHLYEELGLLTPHARSKGRYRLYGPEALVRVRWIGKLQDAGLSLAEITELVRDWESTESAPRAMAKMRTVFESRLQQTREQLIRLRTLEAELTSSLEYLDVCDSCDPVRSTEQCTGCELHGCEHQTPDLVLGVQASG